MTFCGIDMCKRTNCCAKNQFTNTTDNVCNVLGFNGILSTLPAELIQQIPEELPEWEDTHAMSYMIKYPKAHVGLWIQNDLGVWTFQGLSNWPILATDG